MSGFVMNNREMMFTASTQNFTRDVDLYIGARTAGEPMFSIAQPIVFKPAIEGDRMPASLRLSQREAQLLLDALWRTGIRPIEGEGSAGSLTATERHLADMKVIAWHALKIRGAR